MRDGRIFFAVMSIFFLEAKNENYIHARKINVWVESVVGPSKVEIFSKFYYDEIFSALDKLW